MNSKKIITIVGGNGAMGQLFAKYWQNLGFAIRIIDKNDWNNAKTILGQSDLVVVCVPINITLDIINKICPLINPNTILADFTSIKSSILNHMQKAHHGPILSLHPMFGPTITSPELQVIINCDGRFAEQSDWVITSLKQIGFSIVDMNAAEHDKAMGFIQGVEHFSTFALGAFLKQNNQHPQDLFSLASPIYQAKLALLGRIFDQDAKLYADIITADSERLNLISLYVDFLKSWIDKLQTNKKDEFIQEFKDVSKWMGDFTHQSQLASDHFLTEISLKNPNI
jgi:prephenate dehydrogenase